MTYLYLVRHGETFDNANQIMQGQTQGKLNETGIMQAEELSSKLAAEHFDAIVSSDLHRAVETAEIIAKPHHLEVEATSLLRERDWGSFTGRFIPDLQDEEWPDDIESMEKLLSRAQNFITYIRTMYRDKKVVAVGHGIINKAIQAVYHKKTMRDIPRMANAEVRILIF